jgi:hypothetical protein
MKVFFEYKSHPIDSPSENWIVLRDECEEEKKEDILSPVNKDEAIFCTKMYPSDYCIITLRPASRSRTLESITHNYNDEYFIIITNREETESLMSQNTYKWDEVIKIVAHFKSQLFERAKKIFMLKNI